MAVPRSDLASELELAACNRLNPSPFSFLFEGRGPLHLCRVIVSHQLRNPLAGSEKIS